MAGTHAFSHRRARIAALLTGALAVAAVAAAVAPVAPARAAGWALPENGELAFDVMRAGEPIGRHVLTFHNPAEDELRVRIAIDLEVRFIGIPVFRYSHQSQEVWRDGRLARLSTRTNDDGREYFVDATKAVTGGDETSVIEIRHPEGTVTAPPDIVPTSYWNRAILSRPHLLNTQDGRLLDVGVETLGLETVTARGQMRRATRYRLTGDLRLDLWFDDGGQLVKLRFEDKSGTEIDYVLR